MPDGAPLPAARNAYAALRERILSNHYAPGRSVSIAEVTAELGMSRTPLRDALIRLEEERLIELVPRQGFRVLPVHPRAMREAYEVLAGLEITAIELLATRGADAIERDGLAEAGAALGRALAERDRDAWARADARFHAMILATSRNERLQAIADGLLDQTRRARAVTLHLRPPPEASTRAHQAVIAAILAGDAGAAREIHLRQRLRSARELTDILEKLNISTL